jgi:hypothetical protein
MEEEKKNIICERFHQRAETMIRDLLTIRTRNMVAAGSLFLLCLTASSYHFRNGCNSAVRRHATPLFVDKFSSSSSGPRREDRTKGFLSAQSSGIEGQIDDGVDILKVDVRQLKWEEKYLLLKQFQDREGHCNVPKRDTENGINLGTWVGKQRQLQKTGQLDPDRQARLEETGFRWMVVLPTAWEEKYLLLKRFKAREGHCNVSHSHKEDRANLGVWVSHQRQLKTKERLDPDRQDMLEEIGLEWVLNSATWAEMYALLKQFKTREGQCNVPRSHTEDGIKLGVWVANQCCLKKMGTLDPDRQKCLEDIGFEWVRHEKRWDETFSLLERFKEREQHCNIPSGHTEDGINLGRWVKKQRQFQKNGSLDGGRKKRLEEIGFEWDLTSMAWDKTFALLQQFNKREGHCNVPSLNKEDGANLGVWVSRQRQLKTKERLDPDRQKLLEEIGFEWVLASAIWDKMCALFKQFKIREGHGSVPIRHTEDGIKLGVWVANQCRLKKTGTLDLDRQKRLDEIGIEWVRLEKRWEESFSRLERFKDREGHCDIPFEHAEDGINLGTWVSRQRQLYAKETLDSGRKKRLEEIGIEWVSAFATWEEIYALLRHFKKREGHLIVPSLHKEDGDNLGRWVQNQRQLKKNGRLDRDRQKSLEEIGFVWVLPSATWDEMYALLEKFEKRVGHCNVSQLHKEDKARLGSWVARQRHLKKTGKLDLDRQKRLDKIGFGWILTSGSWWKWFSLLQQFKMREGHCNVQARHIEDGEHLGRWVSVQRQLKKKGKLDPGRKRHLDESGFQWVRYARSESIIPPTLNPSSQ